MDPVVSTTSKNHASENNQPYFATNTTNWVTYRDNLRMWTNMIKKFAEVEKESIDVLRGAGLMIYHLFVAKEQQMLRKQARSGELDLEGEHYSENTRIIEKIIKLRDKESQTETVRCQLDHLMEIPRCQRT